MKKPKFSNTDIKSLALMIGASLEKQGLSAVLVGGACVSIYSENRYQSYDLDFVTYDDMKKVAFALSEIGFIKKGRYFIHPDCPYFIDFVNPPIAIGKEPIKHFEKIKSALGILYLLTPTDSVKDRLASYYHWNDRQALEQALLISKHCKVQMNEIQKWSENEGFLEKFLEFQRQWKNVAPT